VAVVVVLADVMGLLEVQPQEQEVLVAPTVVAAVVLDTVLV
jgi:hypothetical protein